MRSRTKNRRGIALVIALGFTAMILSLGIALITMSVGEQKANTASGNAIMARSAAEAGIEKSILQLNTNTAWRCAGSPSGFTNQAVSETLAGAGSATNFGTFTVDAIAQDATTGNLTITSHGYFPDATSTNRVEKVLRVVCYPKQSNSFFDYGAFAQSSIMLGNGNTDSYNSGAGSYASQSHGALGGIGTNSTSPTSIDNAGRSSYYVGGDVVFGPGTNVAGNALSVAKIAGTRKAATTAKTLPAIVVPLTATNVSTVSGNGGSTNISNSLTLTGPGTYVCQDINLSGSQYLNVTGGAVTLYVTGNMNIGGNATINCPGGTPGIPGNLTINDNFNGSVSLGGGSVCCAFYAPNAVFNLNLTPPSAVYGSLIGNQLQFNANPTTQVHYDTALGGAGGAVSGYDDKTWEEQ